MSMTIRSTPSMSSCAGRRVRSAIVIVAAALASLSVTHAAENQPAIPDRPSDRPLEEPGFLPPQEAQPEFELPPVIEPPAAQPERSGAPVAGLQVDGYQFTGNTVVSTEVLQKIAKPYSGRIVSSAELEELRQALTRHYVDAGYINSGALLPDDFYRDGMVHFQIVEGRISDIRAQGLGRLRPTYLRQRLIRPDEPLNVNALQERFQLLLSDPLFSKVNVRLAPGADPGSAVLDVDVTRARPWDLSIFYNNYQPPSVGSEAFGLSGVLRNVTGLGDTIDMTCQQGPVGTDKSGRCNGGFQMPVYYRTDIHFRYDYGESSVLEEPVSSLDIRSRIESYEAGISHALIDTTRQRAALGLTFTHRENKTTIGAVDVPFESVPSEPPGLSKVNAIRFEQDYVHRWENQAFALRSTFSWGHTNTIPGTDFPQQYFFWLGQAQLTRRVLDNGASIFLRGNLQWTKDHLVPLEQIAVGGVASVRGYRENQLVRDQGYYLNLEFRYPLFERDGGQHRLYVIPFVDYGEAWNVGQDRERLASIGLGLNWQFHGLFADLYYGKKLIKPEVQTSGDLQDEGIHFQVRYQF
jgi:hemolysin activation/secretion protein